MKILSRKFLLGSMVALGFLTITAVMIFKSQVTNIMHPALDTLSKLQLQDRWSHPELLKIRAMGDKAIPPLRKVLRERDSDITQLLFWVKNRWPNSTNYFSFLPDENQIVQRQWVACQVIQTLGPTGRPAAPELIQILTSTNFQNINGASMALYAINIDADICEQLAKTLQEKKVHEFGKSQAVHMLGIHPSPSPLVREVVVDMLSDSSEWVKAAACDTLIRWKLIVPEAQTALLKFQVTTTNCLHRLTALHAIWTTGNRTTFSPLEVFKLMDEELKAGDFAPFPSGTDGGQGINTSEQLFMKAGALLVTLSLDEKNREEALNRMKAATEKSGRIFVKMLLLPDMIKLGLKSEEALAVTRVGLSKKDDYYKIHAARLLAEVAEHYPNLDLDLRPLLESDQVGVRVYAAHAHWKRHSDPKKVIPILIDAMDRKKHQSYYYGEVFQAACELLEKMGPEGRGAIPALKANENDPNPKVAALVKKLLVNSGVELPE